jgi:imidazoleglycerol-phosphate dehydratase
MSRRATRVRTTKETSISLSIDLDGSGVTAVSTGIPFYDHMLDQLGRHGGFDLTIEATGDLHIDTHHTVEDVAIALGEAFREAVGDKVGVRRFASGLYPLDEALVEVALDLSGRPFVVWEVPMPECLPLGNPPFDPQLAEHAVTSFATAAGITLHVTLRRGHNVHHIIEATFKGLARCLRDAVRIEGDSLPSTKGVL